MLGNPDFVSLIARPILMQLQEITVCTFSIQLGQMRLQSPMGSKKMFFSIRSEILTQLDRQSADSDFLQPDPWRSWKQLWIDLGRKLPRHSEARKTNFQHFRGKSSDCMKISQICWLCIADIIHFVFRCRQRIRPWWGYRRFHGSRNGYTESQRHLLCRFFGYTCT